MPRTHILILDPSGPTSCSPVSPSTLKTLDSLRDLLCDDDEIAATDRQSSYERKKTPTRILDDTVLALRKASLDTRPPKTSIRKASLTPESTPPQQSKHLESRGRHSKKIKRKIQQRTMSEPPTFRLRRSGAKKDEKKEQSEIRKRLFKPSSRVTNVKKSLQHTRSDEKLRVSPINTFIPDEVGQNLMTLTTRFLNAKTNIKAMSQDDRHRKLKNFFGDSYTKDVSVSDIEKGGLKVLLTSRVPLAYFFSSVVQDLSSENLTFFLDASWYAMEKWSSVVDQHRCAQIIVDTYLSSSGHFELNVNSKTRSSTLEKFQNSFISSSSEAFILPKDCFKEAVVEVVKVMEDSYRKFRAGTLYNSMKNDLGNQRSFNENIRCSVTSLLSDLLQPADSERVKLLKPHIRRFCQKMLSTDFDDVTMQVKSFRMSALGIFGPEED